MFQVIPHPILAKHLHFSFNRQGIINNKSISSKIPNTTNSHVCNLKEITLHCSPAGSPCCAETKPLEKKSPALQYQGRTSRRTLSAMGKGCCRDPHQTAGLRSILPSRCFLACVFASVACNKPNRATTPANTHHHLLWANAHSSASLLTWLLVPRRAVSSSSLLLLFLSQ